MINYLDVEGRPSTCIKSFHVCGWFLNSPGGIYTGLIREGLQKASRRTFFIRSAKNIYDTTKLLGQMDSS